MPNRLPIRGSILAAAAAFALSHAALAADPSPQVGAQISAQCAACHGSNGLSVDNAIPNLAGQHYVYLVKQLKAFRDKSRVSPLMNELARGLTDEQIQDIAAYYASLPIHVGTPAKPKSKP